MADSATFAPAWASPPGSTIASVLAERSVENGAFAEQLGITEVELRELLAGNLRIDRILAESLSATLGSSVEFWIARDAQYTSDLQRLASAEEEIAIRDWLRTLPTRNMREWGWIDAGAEAQRGNDLAVACFEFFDVDGLADWNANYRAVADLVAFRRSTVLKAEPASVAAWLRQGERVGSQVECRDFNRDRLVALLPQLRSLTRIQDPTEFLPRLTAACATAGVAIAIVRAPARCGVSGAARFLSDTKALVQLSFRYRSDDHFWFTLFHELGHLILHGADAFFLEGQGLMDTEEEEEANEFSGDVLIPKDIRNELSSIADDYRQIVRFAKRIGISPGIVVGQLQHIGLVPRSNFNKLKVRYAWN